MLANIVGEIADTHNSIKRSGVIRQEHLRRFVGSYRMLKAYATENNWDAVLSNGARRTDTDTLLNARLNRAKAVAEIRALGFEGFDPNDIPDVDFATQQKVVNGLRASGVTPLLDAATDAWSRALRHSIERNGLISTPQRDGPRVQLIDQCDAEWDPLIDGATVVAIAFCEVIVLLPDVCPGLWAAVGGLIVGKYLCKLFSDGFGVYP